MTDLSRRAMIQGSLAVAGSLALGGPPVIPSPPSSLSHDGRGGQRVRGRLQQSVSRWPFESIPLSQFCQAAREIGLVAIDLLNPPEWDVVRDHGLVCSMGYATQRRDFLTWGFNRVEHHATLLDELERTIPLAKQKGVPNVIAMFGNRDGLDDARGAENCVTGLSRIKALAEQEGVTVCVELLNSKVDHKDYQGDHTPWAVNIMKAVDSPRVKLLYDIYHMQIMEGDVIRTIRDNHQYIAHYHTGGVPGRHELDATQELNYHAIAGAIAETGFTGYVAHEFMPTGDPIKSLRAAFEICAV